MEDQVHILPRDDSGSTPRSWRPGDAGAVLVKCPTCSTSSTVAVSSLGPDGEASLHCPVRNCALKSKFRLSGWPIPAPVPKPPRQLPEASEPAPEPTKAAAEVPTALPGEP